MSEPIQDLEQESVQDPDAPETVEQEDESTESERNSKELLTREKVTSLMEGDPLQTVAVGIFDGIVENVEKGKTAAKVNTESYASALKQYKEENSDEFAEWAQRNSELDNTLSALKQKIAEHTSKLTEATEKYRTVADVDLGSVNERQRKMKVSLFNFLTAAGVSDADTTYRVPELPTSAKISTGWSPRLGKVLVNSQSITYSGDNPTLTDLNKTLNIKGDGGSGATWAGLFGARDIPTSGLSVNRTINGKTFYIQIFGR